MDREAAEGNYSSWDFYNKLPGDGHQPNNSESEEITVYSWQNACDTEHVWKQSPCLE